MKEKLLNYTFITILAFGVLFYLDRCSKQVDKLTAPEVGVLIQSDTIFADPTPIKFKVDVPRAELVYIDTGTKQVIRDTIYGKRINKYTDSLADDNLTLYYTSLIDGELISKEMSYKLKVPLTINNSFEKKSSLRGFYVTSEFGGDKTQFSNVSLGAMYVNKKRNSFNYRYNFIEKTHNVGIGFKLK